MNWTMEDFLTGQRWGSKTARAALPVLVARAEKYKDYPEAEIPEFTYGDLAEIVSDRSHAHPIPLALGSIGCALQMLEKEADWRFGKIPPIQLIVWSEGKGSPGDLAFGFIGISKQAARKMKPEVRRFTARTVRAGILKYAHWRKVLDRFGLKPLTIDLPSSEKVKSSPRFGRGGGESEDHERLKLYVASHYREVGLKGRFASSFEEILLSGDKADLILDDARNRQRVCIEVKSRLSSDADLIRGIFQCVKYAAILAAHERYELARAPSYSPRNLRTILVTERKLPDALQRLSRLLGVPFGTVRVPESFKAPSQ